MYNDFLDKPIHLLRSSGRGFDSRSGRWANVTNTRVISAFYPGGIWVNRIPTRLAEVKAGRVSCSVGWRITVCDPRWAVTLRSSEIGYL